MPELLQQSWREKPGPGMFEMTIDDLSIEPAIFRASGNYNQDKMRMANALEIPYQDVRLETVWMVWAPKGAEAEWRESRCSCTGDDDFLGHTFPEDQEICTTTEPADEVWDFWDETGSFCPWVIVERGHPGAVKFRRPADA